MAYASASASMSLKRRKMIEALDNADDDEKLKLLGVEAEREVYYEDLKRHHADKAAETSFTNAKCRAKYSIASSTADTLRVLADEIHGLVAVTDAYVSSYAKELLARRTVITAGL
eukprot:1046165-Pleurochrysis_carterae.AAC.1